MSHLQESDLSRMGLHCPICHSPDPSMVRRGVWDTPARNVLACPTCGVLFLHPMMAPSEAASFYDSYEKYERQREPSAADFNRKEEKERQSAARQMALVEEYLSPEDTLCDIGASYGHFLRLAMPKVSAVVAIEPNPRSRSALLQQGVRTYNWLEDLPQDGVRVDAVAMFHTFEHLLDPVTFLATLKSVLNPHARLFIEVPNANDALITLYSLKAFQRFYYQSMHCYYYDAASLTHVLEHAGFSPVTVKHLQRYSLGNHLQWLAKGKPGGNVEFDSLFQELDAPYRTLLCDQQKSDTLFAVFALAPGSQP